MNLAQTSSKPTIKLPWKLVIPKNVNSYTRGNLVSLEERVRARVIQPSERRYPGGGIGERARQIEVFRERTCPCTANLSFFDRTGRSSPLYPILLARFTLHARCNSALAISSASQRPPTHLKSPIYWMRELLIFLPYKALADPNASKREERVRVSSSLLFVSRNLRISENAYLRKFQTFEGREDEANSSVSTTERTFLRSFYDLSTHRSDNFRSTGFHFVLPSSFPRVSFSSSYRFLALFLCRYLRTVLSRVFSHRSSRVFVFATILARNFTFQFCSRFNERRDFVVKSERGIAITRSPAFVHTVKLFLNFEELR